MFLPKILTSLVMGAVLMAVMVPANAQNPGDNVLQDMGQAFKKGDRRKLTQLLPLARGHVLEPWAAYWELKARLDEAAPEEVDDFLARYAGTYQEDRLRGDWLHLLGQRRDWDAFSTQYPLFRMNDDRELRCYALWIDQVKGQALPTAADELRRSWYAQRDADDGCTQAAARLYAGRQLSAADIWRKARLATEANRGRAARDAVEIVAPEALPALVQMADSPAKYLTRHGSGAGAVRKELVVLALIRAALGNPDGAAQLFETRWGAELPAEARNWVMGVIGKQAAMKLDPDALGYFAKVRRDADLTDDMLGWKVRAALRAGQWELVPAAIRAMSPEARNDPAWIYWNAKAGLALARGESARTEALQALQGLAGPRGFYEQLALDELGQKTLAPPRPAPLTPEERAQALNNPGLARALYAIQIGLRPEGVREWNYATNLHTAGGMGERDLLAAADLACQREVWDRCINTSERTRSQADFDQRYPMPFHDLVLRRSREIGLDPAYVYGLMRQESRFVMDARSGVGASGLMQVMPATARWTAKKIGFTGFSPEMLADRDTNVQIGTAYLKLVLDNFSGSMALAAAAYNAGPGRPRTWRIGPVLDTAIWAENIPFSETRDYVKKVLANTNVYAALISGQAQSLKSRLGTVGPRDDSLADAGKDLP
ncbi:MAG: lytic transglycosylase domain-containing protein [Curvibacter sp.]|nr:lytic transglycosylase domain-containing protein [Curvibacter sp.]